MAERFGVVVAIGLTFFGLMLIASQDASIGFNFGGEQPDQQLTVVSESFGELGGATEDVRTTSFGSFNIGEGMGQIQVFQRNNLDLSNSLFSENSQTFEYNATQPENADISFEVLGTEGSGALYFEVNDQRVFEEQLVSSATEEINVSSDRLRPGMNNFEIGVNKGGFLGSTEYALEDVEAYVRDRRFNDHRDSFQMYQYELRDFVGANLSFNIPVDSSVVTEPLEIDVNGNNIYIEDSVRAEQTVSVTPSNSDLGPGFNTLTFSTDADAQYRIENAQMAVRYIGTTEGVEREIEFDLSNEDLSFVEREDTEETVSFDYQALSGNRELDFQINDYTTTLMPENGENSEALPEEIFEDENTFAVEGQGSFTLDNLRIDSEVSEE